MEKNPHMCSKKAKKRKIKDVPGPLRSLPRGVLRELVRGTESPGTRLPRSRPLSGFPAPASRPRSAPRGRWTAASETLPRFFTQRAVSGETKGRKYIMIWMRPSPSVTATKRRNGERGDEDAASAKAETPEL